MGRRRVTHSRKDNLGRITKLCNPNEFWSPRKSEDAIKDIENSNHEYYVRVDNKEVTIVVIDDSKRGKYLRTDPDQTKDNNLDYLPDC